jgi:hypothetical protein
MNKKNNKIKNLCDWNKKINLIIKKVLIWNKLQVNIFQQWIIILNKNIIINQCLLQKIKIYLALTLWRIKFPDQDIIRKKLKNLKEKIVSVLKIIFID